jgi:nucleoid-associated protein YgaU
MALDILNLTGSLEKLNIFYEKGGAKQFDGKIEALFNPSEISINKSVNWNEKKEAEKQSSEELKFEASPPAELTLNLFFDTYGTGRRISVTKYTDQVVQLAGINRELHRPPICKLTWGKFRLFQGVLTQLGQKFNLFLPDGTPVRATLSCTFREYRSSEEAARATDLHSADVPKTHTVRRGDTLSSIAAQHYNDPRLWRHIATANNIMNPRTLAPGRVLRVPKLRR